MLAPSDLRLLHKVPSQLGLEQATGTHFRLAESLLDPAALILSLLCLVGWYEDHNVPAYTVLIVLVFSLSFPGKVLTPDTWQSALKKIVLGWLGLTAILWIFGFATGLIAHFRAEVLLHWLWLAPLFQLAAHAAFRSIVPLILAANGYPKRAIIVGCNELGRCLAEEIAAYPMQGIEFDGYFDDRDASRLELREEHLLGYFVDVPAYVKQYNVALIYLALPMASQPRVLALLEGLKDTTASIYFVPDVFLTDLIQARMAVVGHMPVVAICDTPFRGGNGFLKRCSDIVLSLLILLLISPVLLVVTLLIKFSSPGSVIFRQRRYGLDGREIIVYKFRSMTASDDGQAVPQATRDDPRITPLGAFLRKTSLDELPQFVNVLQGRMSIVGPRPHAVAHNEAYRKVVRGYMVRHKVKPGITGWAQVNGCRGETDTVEKMRARVDYDLEYLRNWSLGFDLRIIFRTVLLVFKDAKAY